MSRDRLYLLHILACVRRIQRHTRDGRDPFMGHPTTQDVNRQSPRASRQLAVLGPDRA